MKKTEKFILLKNNIINSEVATKLIKNTGWIVGDKVFTMIIGVFVTAIVTRYFGPEKYGRYNYALAFVTLFTAISTLGLETLTVKSIVDKKYDEGTILCTSLVLRVFGGILLTFISSIIIRIIEPNDENIRILVLVMSLSMVFKALEVIEYWIQANQRAKISSVIRMFVYIVISGFKIILIIFKGNIIHYSIIYLLDSILMGAALFIAYFNFRENYTKWKIDINYAKNILSQSWYLIVSGLMVSLYMQMDKVMLGSLISTKTEVGIYSAATQVAQMWYFVPMALITSFNPVIMNKKKTDEGGYIKSVQLLYDIVAGIGISFGIIIVLLSGIIVNILYGPEFAKAADILTISVWAGTFAILGSARSAWMICEGLQKYSVIYIGSGAVVNLVLNYLLIPKLGGFGAATATLMSQVTAVVIAPAFINSTRVSSIMILKSFNVKRIIEELKYILKNYI